MVCPEETVTPEQAGACEQPRTPRAPFEVRMAAGDERVMRRPAAYLPSSMLAWRRLLAVGASFRALTLLLLLLIGSRAAQASDATTLPADVVFKPEILLVHAGERRLSVPLRPKRAAVESFPGGVFSLTNCTYEGRVYEQGSRTTGRAVVTACPGEVHVHALIITPSGEALSVGPSQSSGEVSVGKDGVGGSAHVVRREAATSKLLTSWTKPSTRRRRATKAAATSRERAIELAVFVDAALVDSMPTERALNTRLTAVLEQVQLVLEYRSLSRPVKLDIVNLEMVDSKRGPSTANGDIDTYLDNFCVWQCNRKQQAAKQGLGTWDHAMMLSGLDLHKGTNKRVLGLAWVNGMCRCRYSCTLSEARSLEAALVVAHELGHSLGMRHDGPPDNRCDPDRYIMSAQTGAGKTSWSVCSGQYLEDFLSSRTSSCLQSRSSQTVAELDGQPLPGQLYPADAQCKLALGSDYSVYTSSRSPFNDVCKELWCLEGSYASPAHPALDGTACAKGKHCREGSCVVVPAGQESDGAVSSTRKVTRSTTTTTTTAAVPATPPRRSTFDVITNIWNRFFSGFPRWF